MRTTGGCFCGAIEYTAEIDPGRVGICHCRDCQILSGSAFRTTAIVEPARFEVTKGRPRGFEKKAASGNVRRLLFCGDCGTHICSLPPDPDAPDAYVSLRAATSVDFQRLAPVVEIWCRSKLRWMPKLEGTKAFDEQY